MTKTASSEGGRLAKVKAKARELLTLRGEAREDYLVNSDNIGELVPLLPPDELLFTLRSAARENALEIISCATAEQLISLFDLELWDEDILSGERTAYWLLFLADMPEKSLVRWLRKLESPELTILLAPNVTAALADEDGDPPELEGCITFTLDGTYYFIAQEKLADAVKRLLSLLLRDFPETFKSVLETLLMGFDPEKEEEAFQMRSVRIAELGYVSFGEAQSIYEAVAPAAIYNLPHRTAPLDVVEHLAPASYLLTTGEENVSFAQLLEYFNDTPEGAVIYSQLATLTHKVIAADGLDVGDEESYYTAGSKVTGYLSIALATLNGLDEAKMRETLYTHWIENIFRVGWWRVQSAAKAARRLLNEGWPQRKMERLLLIDEPLISTMSGLLFKRPKYFHVTKRDERYRDFYSLSEVEEAERGVAKIDFIGRYLLKAIDFSLGNLNKAVTDIADENMKGSTVFNTGLLNAALGNGFIFAPIPRAKVGEALDKLWLEGSKPKRVKGEFTLAAINWSDGFMEMTMEEKGYLSDFLGDAVALLEDEYGHLPPGETPDPRFLRGIWIK